VFECLAMKDAGNFLGHLVSFADIWYSLWPDGIFCGNLGIFFPVLVCFTKKDLTTLLYIHKTD
jgi:hypothetical protein